MKVKELIKELEKYDKNAFVEMEVEYNDSDDGLSYANMTEFKFLLTKNNKDSFLTITEG